jgi:hypothetical protein
MPVMILAAFSFTGVVAPVAMALFLIAIAVALPLVYRDLKQRARAPVIAIGDDGIVISKGKKHAFYPRMALAGGRRVAGRPALAFSTPAGDVLVSGVLLDDDKTEAVLHTARTRWSGPGAAAFVPPDRAAAFARHGRPIADWQADLRARLATTGYRGSAAVTVEDAEAVLRSAAAPAELRVGAALALAAAGERFRVAEAIGPVAEPQLRVALEHVADERDDPAALEVAMARVARSR